MLRPRNNPNEQKPADIFMESSVTCSTARLVQTGKLNVCLRVGHHSLPDLPHREHYSTQNDLHQIFVE